MKSQILQKEGAYKYVHFYSKYLKINFKYNAVATNLNEGQASNFSTFYYAFFSIRIFAGEASNVT